LPQTRSPQGLDRDRRFFLLAGVRRLAGFLGPEELRYRFDARTGLYESEFARLARVIAELGDARPNEAASWNLHLSATERATARHALGELAGAPLIVCGPGTKMQAKDWGQENWRALLAALQARVPDCGLALIGSRQDIEAGDFAAQDWNGPKVNLSGKLTPRESAAVLEQARIFLGPDSGPMHLAACVGTPCVIAFSARGLPGMWFPFGQHHRIVYHQTSCFGCNLQTCTREARRCLTSITVQEMLDAAIKALESSASRFSEAQPSSLQT
jgi:heptosyltransferase III